MAKKVCPRLHDSACWRSGEITQPRTNFLGQLCKVEDHCENVPEQWGGGKLTAGGCTDCSRRSASKRQPSRPSVRRCNNIPEKAPPGSRGSTADMKSLDRWSIIFGYFLLPCTGLSKRNGARLRELSLNFPKLAVHGLAKLPGSTGARIFQQVEHLFCTTL